jgi:glycosyltransferase involved in cell wall biosynthesis
MAKAFSRKAHASLGKAQMKPKIGLITIQSRKNLSAFEINLKIIRILEPLATQIVWVATNCLGDATELPKNATMIRLDLRDAYEGLFFRKLFCHLLHQFRIMLELWRLRKALDICIFYCGYAPLPALLFAAVLLRKKTILRIDGRASVFWREKALEQGHRTLNIMTNGLAERVAYFLTDRILVDYQSMIKRYDLQKYAHKIDIGSLYVDTTLFAKTKELGERIHDVGYFGRLSKEKGVLQFAQSLPLILKNGERKAIIVGGGDLEERVKETLTYGSIQGKVQLTGWIEIKKMPDYLNDTKIVVIPSYFEGLPNIVLEAMACGTVVLAVPVGGIADLIKDVETGFILEANSPQCIAKNVIRALNHPKLNEITKNARALVEKEYTYEATVERYAKTLSGLE